MIIVYNFELFAVEARGPEVGPVQPLAGGPGPGLAARQNRLTLPGTAFKGTVPTRFRPFIFLHHQLKPEP
jgi:hypothetical protein